MFVESAVLSADPRSLSVSSSSLSNLSLTVTRGGGRDGGREGERGESEGVRESQQHRPPQVIHQRPGNMLSNFAPIEQQPVW